jgi:hypothetical protein
VSFVFLHLTWQILNFDETFNSLFCWHFYATLSRCTDDFEILHGDLQGLPDTKSFLKSLAELDTVYDSEKNSEKRQMREHKAAAGLFNWEVCIMSNKTHWF